MSKVFTCRACSIFVAWIARWRHIRVEMRSIANALWGSFVGRSYRSEGDVATRSPSKHTQLIPAANGLRLEGDISSPIVICPKVCKIQDLCTINPNVIFAIPNISFQQQSVGCKKECHPGVEMNVLYWIRGFRQQPYTLVLLVRHFQCSSLWLSLGIPSWALVGKVRSWKDFIKCNKKLLGFFYLSSIFLFGPSGCFLGSHPG